MFVTDPQTLDDLHIFPKTRKSASVYGLYDRTVTHGGSVAMRSMFLHPPGDADTVRERLGAIDFLCGNEVMPEPDRTMFDFVEYYLSLPKPPPRNNAINVVTTAVRGIGRPTQEQYAVKRGIPFVMEIIRTLGRFASEYADCPAQLISGRAAKVGEIIAADTDLHRVVSPRFLRLSSSDITRYDFAFRYSSRDSLRELLAVVYEFDALASLAAMVRGGDFCLPVVTDDGPVTVSGLRNPMLEDPVPVSVDYGRHNMCFLTGANMSGKSAFMRALSVAVYLAQMGFPVPADAIECPILDGIFTAINLGDDISLGYSHFYAEVERLRMVADTMRRKPRLFVAFDELFRGTNLRDAFEASTEILKGFSRCPQAVFLISTHITEVAGQLIGLPGVMYKYFPSEYREGKFFYSYELREGVSEDRHGMDIIARAGIISILEECGD